MTSTALAAFGGIPFSPAVLAKPDTAKRKGKYPARLEFLANGMCKLVSDGKAKAGHWAVVDGQNTTDLGDSITVIPLVRLDQAIDNSGDEIVVTYGQGTEEYQRIAEEVDENGYDSGCMYGPYYLLYLVDTEQFVELFLKSVSARNEADNIDLFLPISEEAAAQYEIDARAPAAATFGSREVTSKKGKKTYTYNVPTTTQGPTQLNVENPPEQSVIIAECLKFASQAIVEEESRAR